MSKPAKPWFYLLQQQPNDGDICWCKQCRDFPPVQFQWTPESFGWLWTMPDPESPGDTISTIIPAWNYPLWRAV